MNTKHLSKNKLNKKMVFIVEDNELYAKTLQTFIQIRFSDIKEIKKFRIGELCLMELHLNPAIVIMDYFLDSKYEEASNGLEIIKRIKTKKPNTNIIVLSSQNKFNIAVEAIKNYKCNYVQKDDDAFNKIAGCIHEIFEQPNPLGIDSMVT